MLASTSLLTEVVRCLLDQGPGSGGIGPQGPPGNRGKDGKDGAPGANGGVGPAGPGIDIVTVTEVPCDVPPSAVLTGVSPARTLELTLPGCCNKDLTKIADVSWGSNGGTVQLNVLMKPGLGIAFSGPVQSTDLADPHGLSHSVVLLAPVLNGNLTAWEEAAIRVIPGNFATIGKTSSAFTPSGAAQVNGLVITITAPEFGQLEQLKVQQLRVVVKGDFIRDATAQQRAIDADHLPPWLPTRPTGDGIEGGTFESWFVVKLG